MKVAVGAIVKNELPYLLEWLAFHRVMGVDHFIIADNGSTDGTRQFLHEISGLGWLEVIDFPMRPTVGRSAQVMAYATILETCREDIELVAFIDADEFLTPYGRKAQTLKQFLTHRFAEPEVSALALNWACFGSSGQIFREAEPVIERFTRRALKEFGPNHHYKSVVRRTAVRRFMNPHHAELLEGQYINSAGKPLEVHHKHGVGLSAAVWWQGVRINHYVVKSAQEFIDFKSKRGSAAKAGKVKHQAYFSAHDRNDERCMSAYRYLSLVKGEMDRINEQLDLGIGNVNWTTRLARPWRKIFGKV